MSNALGVFVCLQNACHHWNLVLLWTQSKRKIRRRKASTEVWHILTQLNNHQSGAKLEWNVCRTPYITLDKKKEVDWTSGNTVFAFVFLLVNVSFIVKVILLFNGFSLFTLCSNHCYNSIVCVCRRFLCACELMLIRYGICSTKNVFCTHWLWFCR